MKNEKPWWLPEKADDVWLAELKKDYPEKAHMSDDELSNYFNEEGLKYSTTWDHIGDAYLQYEPLSDAFFDLIDVVKEAKDLIDCPTHPQGYVPENCMRLQQAIDKLESNNPGINNV